MSKFGVYGELKPDDPKLGIVIINNFVHSDAMKDWYLQVSQLEGTQVALLAHGQSIVVKDMERTKFKWVTLATVYEEDYKDG